MKNTLKILTGLFATLAFVTGASFATAQTTEIKVTSAIDGGVLEVGTENTVRWQAENFPSSGFVHVNLIKKVSDNPVQYELVRQVANYTLNDGEEVWVPERGDVGENVYVEVTCAGSTRFPEGCVSGQSDNSFAIESSFGNNLAGVLSAFFDKFLGIFIK